MDELGYKLSIRVDHGPELFIALKSRAVWSPNREIWGRRFVSLDIDPQGGQLVVRRALFLGRVATDQLAVVQPPLFQIVPGQHVEGAVRRLVNRRQSCSSS